MDGWGWGRFVNLFIILLFNFVFNLITACSPLVALHALHGLRTCVDLIWVGLDCLYLRPLSGDGLKCTDSTPGSLTHNTG